MGCVLSDYRLRFNMRSKKDGSGKANAVYKVGQRALGSSVLDPRWRRANDSTAERTVIVESKRRSVPVEQV